MLQTERFGRLLRYVSSTESTNADAIRHVQNLTDEPVPHGMTFVAESQRSGRGRRGRTWHSPPEGNIYCSIILAPGRDLSASHHALSWTPLASALAVADGLARCGGLRANVKWPNDVLVNDKKIGGILCEQAVAWNKQPAIIVGIGLNINGQPTAMPVDVRARATSLAAELQQPVDRTGLMAEMLWHLEQRLDRLWSEGPGSLASEFRQRCDTIGKQVRVTFSDQNVVEGWAESIGDDGHLRVLVQSNEQGRKTARIIEVRSADIMHLRAYRDAGNAGSNRVHSA
jgi:BirA family biotin operon repressor/biotin-[acetyl-CoA-carboxylase] ligase